MNPSLLRAWKTGIRLIDYCDISNFLPMIRQLPPTLCISDTHLQPSDGWFVDDAPEMLHDLLNQFPGFQVFLLGDITESLALGADGLARFKTSRGLRGVFRALRDRKLRFILGNHDLRASNVLRRIFGSQIVTSRGFIIDKLLFVHGHERLLGLWTKGADIWRLLIPAGVTLRRLRLPTLELNDNAKVCQRLQPSGSFMIFGHTHKPEIGHRHANSGCFLRHGKRTFIIIEGSDLFLLEHGS